MSVGVMKDYKRRDLHASHTLVLCPLKKRFVFAEKNLEKNFC
jgi:hypothetical protein